MKLNESAISDTLVADTGSESGAEASDLEDKFCEFGAPSCNKWWRIINLETTSKKEHKNSTLLVQQKA